MKKGNPAKLLRIFINSSDKFKHTPLYEVIIYAAGRYKIASATVHKCIMGYGLTDEVYSGKYWEISETIPLVIEIADTDEKILNFIEIIKPYLDKNRKGCLITLENIEIIYLSTKKAG